ncbi:MAG: YpdA family putative bacillithiol disulfide reductase [Spirochaetaceae bacterium]|nr:YpdA family putative bacillithiol disulfide reductase [Spirochaetaceae bacterium]
MDIGQLIIIGAGPAGLACSIAATGAGLDHLVLEKGAIANTIYRFPDDMTFFSTPDKLAIGGVPFTCPDKKPSRRQTVAYYRDVAVHYGLPVRTGHTVTALRRTPGGFAVTAEQHGAPYALAAHSVVVSTGFFDTPVRLGIPGEDLPKCSHYFHDGHPYYGQRVAVVGGGNSAVETALDLMRAGARVTLIHRSAELRRGVKYWVRPELENRVADGAIEARFNTAVESVEPDAVVVRGPDGRERLANDAVLFQIGYLPTVTLLRQLGIGSDPATAVPEHDPDTLETTVPGLFVCGALLAGNIAGSVFIEDGRDHGERIVAIIRRRLQDRRHDSRDSSRDRAAG